MRFLICLISVAAAFAQTDASSATLRNPNYWRSCTGKLTAMGVNYSARLNGDLPTDWRYPVAP